MTRVSSVPQFSILGWSAGANVGAVFAAKYPDRVSRLVLVNGNVRSIVVAVCS